jgi:hypothetical protein
MTLPTADYVALNDVRMDDYKWQITESGKAGWHRF